MPALGWHIGIKAFSCVKGNTESVTKEEEKEEEEGAQSPQPSKERKLWVYVGFTFS